MRVKTLWFLCATLASVLLATVPAVPQPQSPPSNGPTPSPQKRALIVAIETYSPESGWRDISSGNDVPLMSRALIAQGFDAGSIRVLRDEEADKDGILRAFRETLIEPAQPGDIVVFHVSSHGQQITDDDPNEELDGYDEALVPYDAPASEREVEGRDYRGEKHLRDDELADAITSLRRKVGPTGNVIVFLDSCFSGTPRGGRPAGMPGAARVRGGKPFGLPQGGRGPTRGEGEGTGVMESSGARGGGGQGGLAPYVVFSAARHDQLAWETLSDDGKSVGSLSYALSRELASLDQRTGVYRHLFDRVKWLLSVRVTNEPQVEGSVDASIFSGRAVHQDRYLGVETVLSGSRLTVQPGGLRGLLPGARVEIHAEGTQRRSRETLLASGEVIRSLPLKALVNLETQVPIESLERSRAFPTHLTYGDLRVRVALQGLDADLRSRLESLLKDEVPAMEVVSFDPEVIVRQEAQNGSPATVTIRQAATDLTLLKSLPVSTPEVDDRIANRLADYAFSRYLRGLQIRDESFDVTFEIFPVAVDDCPGGEIDLDLCRVTPLDPATKRTEGNQQRWRSGDLFRIRVKNPSPRNAYLALLELAPDGTIAQLWPPPGTSDRTTLGSQQTAELNALYRVESTAREGTEVILLVATETFVDFSSFVTPPSVRGRGRPRGALGPLAPLFDARGIAGRGPVAFAAGSVNTQAVTFTVVP